MSFENRTSLHDSSAAVLKSPIAVQDWFSASNAFLREFTGLSPICCCSISHGTVGLIAYRSAPVSAPSGDVLSRGAQGPTLRAVLC